MQQKTSIQTIVENTKDFWQVEMFPNPFQNELKIMVNATVDDWLGSVVHITFRDLSGRTYQTVTLNLSEKTEVAVNTENIPPGVTLCIIESAEFYQKKKLIKK